MRQFRNITMLLMAVVFLISSSGYVVYTSECVCTGDEKTSVFVKPETCETTYHKHHNHDTQGNEQECSAGECHDCHGHDDNCGCGDPKHFYFKLEEIATNEEAKFLLAEVPLLNVIILEVFDQTISEDTEAFTLPAGNDPPPKIDCGLDFLISIQQLKIPVQA